MAGRNAGKHVYKVGIESLPTSPEVRPHRIRNLRERTMVRFVQKSPEGTENIGASKHNGVEQLSFKLIVQRVEIRQIRSPLANLRDPNLRPEFRKHQDEDTKVAAFLQFVFLLAEPAPRLKAVLNKGANNAADTHRRKHCRYSSNQFSHACLLSAQLVLLDKFSVRGSLRSCLHSSLTGLSLEPEVPIATMTIAIFRLVRLLVNISHSCNLLLCIAVFPMPLRRSLGYEESGRVNLPVTNARPTLSP